MHHFDAEAGHSPFSKKMKCWKSIWNGLCLHRHCHKSRRRRRGARGGMWPGRIQWTKTGCCARPLLPLISFSASDLSTLDHPMAQFCVYQAFGSGFNSALNSGKQYHQLELLDICNQRGRKLIEASHGSLKLREVLSRGPLLTYQLPKTAYMERYDLLPEQWFHFSSKDWMKHYFQYL